MLETLTYSTFAGRLGERFRVPFESAPALELELTEATDLNRPVSSRGRQRGDAFSLVFRGPNERPLGQGLYRFEHDQLGAFPLFIVPIRADQQGRYYEAVFNRLPQGE